MFALAVSLWSVRETRKQYINSSRPYVFAQSYVYESITKIPRKPAPDRVLFRTLNAPARILKQELLVLYKSDTILPVLRLDFEGVSFPADNAQWSYQWTSDHYKKIMNRPDNEKDNLIRIVKIDYTSFGNDDIYHYELHQIFNHKINNWRVVSEFSD